MAEGVRSIVGDNIEDRIEQNADDNHSYPTLQTDAKMSRRRGYRRRGRQGTTPAGGARGNRYGGC